jgi:8-oxo-dGTP pyrophosphatase MutT (NUDIX family)
MSASSDHKPSRWEKRSEQVVAHTRVFDLRSAHYHHPVRGTGRDFYVMHAPDWVIVVALTPEHRMVLVRQFRFGIDDFSIEIPGGVMDHAGEDAVAAGLRELREETGYAGVNARLLGRVHPNPAIMNNRCHFVLVEQCERVAGFAWDPDEEMEVTLAPVDEVYEWARAGRVTHSLVLGALLLFAPIWEKMRA